MTHLATLSVKKVQVPANSTCSQAATHISTGKI